MQARSTTRSSRSPAPSRVCPTSSNEPILDATPRIELVGADADVIDADDLCDLLEADDVSIDARKEVPDTDGAAGLGNRPRMAGADLSTPERRRPHRPRSQYGVCDSSNGFVATLTACFAMSSVACATSQTKPRRSQARITSAPNSVRP